MKQQQLLIIASVVAILLSIFISVRAITTKNHFDASVRESLKTTEGYDQLFIDRVNRLEDLLATRAKFGYSGGKDPMTGETRMVVQPKIVPQVKTRQTQTTAAEPAPAAAPTDPIKLTAIIADATGKKMTAIVMDGERSYSVEPDNVVAGRKITKITNDGIYMETATTDYFYDIYGNVVTKSKESGSVAPILKEDEQQPVVKQQPGVKQKQTDKTKPKKKTSDVKR
jgi:hypothetical protein